MRIILCLLIAALTTFKTFSQGCVAIRSTGGYCSMQDMSSAKWQLSINNRYFKSFRHYVGTEEQKQRQTLGNEVVNHQYTLDLAVTRMINEQWSVMLDVPVASNSRSSLYEHNNIGRYSTHSFGIGDARVAVYRWLLKTAKAHKANVQLGIGIKLPTGSYNYQDYFQLTDSTKRLGAIDQSVQLGDGGTGLTMEVNSFYNLSEKISLYGNFYYLSNPREQNGVSTTRGGVPSAAAIANVSDVMSVPDQYMIRAGANFTLNKLKLSLGLRDECIPVHDLIGASNGFRRPGKILTVEPGINYSMHTVNLFAYVPVAVSRNRTQSVPDKIATQRTGKYTQGDAAFADYVINVGASFKL